MKRGSSPLSSRSHDSSLKEPSYEKEKHLLYLMRKRKGYCFIQGCYKYYEYYDYNEIEVYLKENAEKITWISEDDYLVLCSARDEKMLSLLIKYGAPINLEDEYGRTVLSRAIFSDNLDPYLIETLLKLGAKIKEDPYLFLPVFQQFENSQVVDIYGFGINFVDQRKEKIKVVLLSLMNTVSDNFLSAVLEIAILRNCNHGFKFLIEEMRKHNKPYNKKKLLNYAFNCSNDEIAKWLKVRYPELSGEISPYFPPISHSFRIHQVKTKRETSIGNEWRTESESEEEPLCAEFSFDMEEDYPELPTEEQERDKCEKEEEVLEPFDFHVGLDQDFSLLSMRKRKHT